MPFRKALKRDQWEMGVRAHEIAEEWKGIRSAGGRVSFDENDAANTRPQLLMPGSIGRCMSEWPELKPMKNRLVNYGVSDNGVAIIEPISDSDGEPLEGDKTSVNTYTREMWHDIDDVILAARFDDNVSVIRYGTW